MTLSSLKPSTIYTYHAYIKFKDTSVSRLQCEMTSADKAPTPLHFWCKRGNTNSNFIENDGHTIINMYVDEPNNFLISPNIWLHLVCIFKTGTATEDYPYINFRPYIYGGGLGTTGEYCLKWVKLEEGNKPTDWTPAPEDLETGISDAKSLANTAQSTASNAASVATTAQSDANEAKSKANEIYDWKVSFTAENGEFTVGLKNANAAAKAASDKADGVDDKLDKDIAARNQYMRYSAQADEYGNIKGTLELGDSDSKFKAKINNTELGFYEDDVRVSYINGQKMYITNAEILHLLGIGNFGFQVETDNSVSFGKIK